MRLLTSWFIAACVLLVLAACGETAPESPASASDTSDSPEPSEPETSDAEPAVDRKTLIETAEQLVLDELPDIPLWEGVSAKGDFVSETTVCVDRMYADKSMFGTTNAGFVVVTFPEEKLGEPTDGTCAKEGMVAEEEPTPVDVPDDLTDESGLLVSTDFGDEWPLTVPYGVVRCDSSSVIFTDPDGNDYAVNGTAQSHHPELPDIDPIWAKDPAVKGLKIDISPVIDKGLELC